MTPARAIGPALSAMTKFSGLSARFWPSSVTRTSPGRAGRTMIVGLVPPARLTSAS
jgi:hypothetical protein